MFLISSSFLDGLWSESSFASLPPDIYYEKPGDCSGRVRGIELVTDSKGDGAPAAAGLALDV